MAKRKRKQVKARKQHRSPRQEAERERKLQDRAERKAKRAKVPLDYAPKRKDVEAKIRIVKSEHELREGYDLMRQAGVHPEITLEDGTRRASENFDEVRAYWKRSPAEATADLLEQTRIIVELLQQEEDTAERELLDLERRREDLRAKIDADSDTLAKGILKRLDRTSATEEEKSLVEKAFEKHPDMPALLVATRALGGDGDVTVKQVAEHLGWTATRARRVAAAASALGLLNWSGEEQLNVEDEKGLPEDPYAVTSEDGLFVMPTLLVRRLSEIARRESLPMALPEKDVTTLPALGRHVVVSSALQKTDDGHHFVRANMLFIQRPQAIDKDDRGLGHLMTTLLEDELPTPELERWRKELVAQGTLAHGEGGWYWRDARSAQKQIDEIEANREFAPPYEREVDFPLHQFGTLLDSKRLMPAPVDRGEMPIHVGSRSFEPIWQRHEELWSHAKWLAATLDEASEENRADRENVKLWEVVDAEQVSRSVAANDVLMQLEKATVVTVGIDVAEGLPEWESLADAWEYAEQAYPPFPVTYLDFSTPGGYCPMLSIPTTAGEATATLRGALVMRDPEDPDMPLLVRPFAWLEAEPYDPRPPGIWFMSDYDSVGLVSFGGKPPQANYEFLRIKGPPGIVGHAAVIRNSWALGAEVPGWTEIVSDFDYPTGWDADDVFRAHAHVALAAASRTLSVLYALDSTVNVELEEAEAPRAERRAAQRAEQKGKQTHIAKTVMIRRSRSSENGRKEPSGKKRDFTHAFWRRGHYAYYPLGTQMADSLALTAPNKLVEHPEKGTCRKVFHKATIVGETDEDGRERRLVAKSYVWRERKK